MIFVNFKTYQSGTGEEALKMAEVVEKVSRETGIEMACVVQAVDVYRVAKEVLLPVYVQHVDAIEYGANTGWTLPEGAKEAGAMGAVINHSERKIENIKYQISNIKNKESATHLEMIIKRCKEVGLKTLVCGEGVEEIKEVLKLDPDFVAYEPPELIGGKVSVSSARPEVVREVMELSGQERILIGAGIHTAEDIKTGLELGAFGFLVASVVMTSEKSEMALRELVKGYG